MDQEVDYNMEYNVVIDVLQKHKNKLQKMVKSNIALDRINIMDAIRLEQISQLEQAIQMWETHVE